jgi:hypothetical protein
MQNYVVWWRQRSLALLLSICTFSCVALAASQPHYLITNDDDTLSSSVTFYVIEENSLLHLDQRVLTGGTGIAGGYFSTNRLAVLDNGTQQCVYASDAFTGDVVGIDINTLAVSGSTPGSPTDSGNANGIGLAVNSQYLYASYTTSNTIGTFEIEQGCSLTFINDVPVSGLQGGFIDAMTLHGNMMVVTYGDGSIESFDISSGTPVSNGDEQNSTGYFESQGASYPNSAEITKSGRYALFGDTSTSTLVEVSDISSGKLRKTTVYRLGSEINSSNILLSPDETLLYISNTEGDSISAAWFDASTGKLFFGCTSGKLRAFGSRWSYAAGLALGSNTGTGGTVYIAEFGGPSSIGMVAVSSNVATCTLTELPQSPEPDQNSGGLLSIEAFPPRPF